MGIIPLTFAAALIIGGLLMPIVTGDSDMWAGTAIALVLAVVLVVGDRIAARRRTRDEADHDRQMGMPGPAGRG